MKQIIFRNWHFMRLVRLVLGMVIAIQAVANKDAMFAVFWVLFAVMALLNYGCCGISGCDVPTKKSTQTTNDIVYEEVVNNK